MTEFRMNLPVKGHDIPITLQTHEDEDSDENYITGTWTDPDGNAHRINKIKGVVNEYKGKDVINIVKKVQERIKKKL